MKRPAGTTWEASVEWTRIVAGCVIRQDSKYLLVQEKQEIAYGLWNIPAGHVDRGETIREAAIREAAEETGYTVEIGDEIALIHESVETAIKHVFEAKIIGGKACIDSEEILDIQWFSFAQIEALHKEDKIRRPWVFKVLQIAEGIYAKQ